MVEVTLTVDWYPKVDKEARAAYILLKTESAMMAFQTHASCYAIVSFDRLNLALV